MRRILLWLLVLLGLYVGIWSALFPASFYASFPGPFGAWIALDGPYNEHLVRDVGAFYVGLAVATAVATRYPDHGACLVVALAWLVYSVPHLGYHLQHLGQLDAAYAVAQVVSLSCPLVLAVPLLFPDRGSGPADRAGARSQNTEVAS